MRQSERLKKSRNRPKCFKASKLQKIVLQLRCLFVSATGIKLVCVDLFYFLDFWLRMIIAISMRSIPIAEGRVIFS